MYGSSLRCWTSSPRFSSSAPMDAAERPLPSELTTPPVTNRYFVFLPRLTMACPSEFAGGQERPRALQVLRRVDAEPAVGGLCDPNPDAVLERPELLQRLLLLEEAGRERGEPLEERRCIPVDAHRGAHPRRDTAGSAKGDGRAG